MSDPDFSESESIGCISDFSIGDYSNHSDDRDDNDKDNSIIEIEMDSKPIKTPSSKTPSSTSTGIVKKVITKRTIPIKNNKDKTNESNLEDVSKTDNSKPSKSKPIARKKNANNNKEEGSVSAAGENELSVKEAKESVADSKFQLNDETIEYFCKDILEDIKKICVVNSTFNNDTALLCLLLKLKIITEYKCAIKKCKTGKTWLGKPIQLLIHRKNGKMHDLTTSNLELICSNCYMAAYGIDLFIKVLANTIYKCTYCGFPLNNFSNSKKKERICMACESRIVSSSYFSKRSEYINELKDTIDGASQLKKDEFVQSNYYSEVSRYKSFDGESSGAKSTHSKKSSTSTFNNKPIINLNLSVPNIDELIGE